MKRALRLGLCALLASSACSDAGPPSLALDTLPDCASGDSPCMDREPLAYEVDGVRVLQQRIEGHPLLAIQISFDVVDDPDAVQVWAETMGLGMLEWAGPAGLGTVAFADRLADLNATFSASAGRDYHSVRVSVPPRRFRAMWSLLRAALADPALDLYLLEARRRNALAGYASELDEASSAASVEAFSRLFRGQFANLRRESRAALEGLATSDVAEAFRALRTKRRMLVSVAGDLDQDTLKAAVRDAFSELPDDYAPSFGDAERELGPSERVAVLDYPESPTWHIRSYLIGPSDDLNAYAALALGLSVLSDRLFDQVRDAAGLAYSAGAGLNFYRQSYGSIWVSTEAPVEALGIARDNIAALKSDGPNDAELAQARESLRADALTSTDTPGAVAAVLADWELTAGSFDARNAYLDALDAVSAEDVRAALETYLKDVVTVAAGSGEPLSEDDLRGLFEE